MKSIKDVLRIESINAFGLIKVNPLGVDCHKVQTKALECHCQEIL
ncbi:hypothetical protein [Methanothrix sp.]|nr:hypothetical protein [Methanothrix sp.]